MRVPYLSMLAIAGLYIVATAPSYTDARAPVSLPAHELSERALGSGVALALDAARFCAGGGKPVRHATHGEASEKQRLEHYLRREVCAGRMPLGQAEAELAGNWLAAYRRYLGGAD